MVLRPVGKFRAFCLLLHVLATLLLSAKGFVPARATHNRALKMTEISAIPRGGALSPEALALAKTLAPQVGVLTSTALYFAPALSVWKAIKENDMGDLNPLPLAIMSIVSLSWLAYGLASRDKYVALSNIAGAIGSIGYVVGILPLLANSEDLRRTQTVLMGGVTAVIGLWSYLGVASVPIEKVTTLLGLFAASLFVVLSGSPLSTIRTVIQKKNSASILGSLTAAQVVNTSLWSVYGLAIKDRFVWGPNVVGLGLGLVQLALKISFPARNK